MEEQELDIDDESGHNSDSDRELPVPFPIPDQTDLSVCRDHFLKDFLEPYGTHKRIVRIAEGSHVAKRKAVDETNAVKTAEYMLFKRFLLGDTTRGSSIFDESSLPLRAVMSLTWNERQEVFKRYHYKMQKGALEYLCLTLMAQFQALEIIWPGDVGILPHKLFSWSVEHFLRRLDVNQMYLDLVELELTTAELDTLKFKIDMREVDSLLLEILSDVRLNVDVCESSMETMRNSHYDENSDVIGDLNELRADQSLLVRNLFSTRANAFRQAAQRRLVDLLNQSYKQQVMDPIENRYRLNWLYSTMDQGLYFLEMSNNSMEEELAKLNKSMIEDGITFTSAYHVYRDQISNLKTLNDDWQLRYDQDLDNAELLCTTTRLSLQKAKDDYKFYNEQVEMFRERIAVVRALIAIEEQQAREAEEKRIAAEMAKMAAKGKKKKKKKKDKKPK